MSSWGKSGSAWAGRSAATASSTNPEESVFSTLQIDGRSQGKSNGAWGKKQTHKEEDTKKFGSTTTKYVSTLWGAIAREKEKQEASRTIPTLGKTGFGTSKTGFGKTGTTGFGTGAYGKTGTTSFGSGTTGKTGFGTGKTGTTGTGTGFGSGSKFSFGKTAAAKNMPKPEDNPITSRGQPFCFFTIELQQKTNEIESFQAKHICSTPRYNDYPIEMLRWYDYVFGGGIAYADPHPPETKAAEKTGLTGKTGFGAGGQPVELVDISPWEADLTKVSQFAIKLPAATETKLPYGALPPTQFPAEQANDDGGEDDDEIIVVKQRGFLQPRTIFDNMKDYDGPSHTIGLINLIPKNPIANYN